MKILVIGPGKMKYMPYAHFYLDNIDWKAHELHVAYWNRDEKEEDLSQFEGLHLHEFRKYMVNDAPLKTKLRLFYSFRKFCIKILKQNEFDYIIVLHSIPAVVLYDWLTKRYAGRYIFDYRDSTYEPRVDFFKKMVGNIIRSSNISFTSSDGFRIYYPDDVQNKILTTHNLLEDSLNHREYPKTPSDKIRIAFWGFIRQAEFDRVIINRISRDTRFELHFYGREQKDALAIKEYVAEQKIENVFFHGEYMPNDRYEFVRNTDIIHNMFSYTNMLPAMGNKYYDGIIFRIPQICFPGSQMSKMCETAGIGVSLDPRKEDFCDKLYSYYQSLNRSAFNQNCDTELDRVLDEYNKGRKLINEIFH